MRAHIWEHFSSTTGDISAYRRILEFCTYCSGYSFLPSFILFGEDKHPTCTPDHPFTNHQQVIVHIRAPEALKWLHLVTKFYNMIAYLSTLQAGTSM
jgi:hypothetical protein